MPADTAVNQYLCTWCPLSFADRLVLKKHKKTVHPRCMVCNQRFDGRNLLQSHQRATGHSFCRECGLHFKKWGQYMRHVRNIQHGTEYQCCDCSRKYPDQIALNNHCCDCDKAYRTSKALNKHFKASGGAHDRPRVSVPRVATTTPTPSPKGKKPRKKPKRPRNIPCPIGDKCRKKFAIPSAVISHLESGKCRSGMTRTELNKLVFTHDKNRYISHEAAFSALMWKPPSADPLDLPDDTDPVFRPTEDVDSLSGWSVVNDESLLAPTASEADAESDWSLVSGIHTPLSNALDPQPPATTVFHTDFSLRCPICPPTLNKRTFASAKALQEHVSSLAHAPKIFHCPFTFPIDGEALNGSGDTNTRKKKKQKEKYFKTLSGLAMHMENGACKGGVEVFREAMRYVEEEVRKTGFVTVKLLG